MSVASEINRISQNISNALSAITNKGVTVPIGANSNNLASLIGQIETGSEVVIMDEKDAAGGIKRSVDTGANKIKRIVKGTAPLSLTMVKAGPLTKLTQYGKIEIVGTPSPTSPATIKCNNGTLTPIEEELPPEYKRVLDLTLAGARFVTATYLTGDDTLRFSASGSAGNWIGAYNSESANDNYSFYASTNTTAKYLRYDGGTYNSSIVNNTRYDIVITPTGSSGCRTPETWTEESFTCSVPLCIGATSPEGTVAPDVTFYGNIEVDGVAVFIPCERVSDNKLGYYEYYSGEFYEDTEDGTVTTSGYDGSYLTYILPVGDNEVITVGNSTQDVLWDLLAVGDKKDELDIISGEMTYRTITEMIETDYLDFSETSEPNVYYYLPYTAGLAHTPVISSHFTWSDEELANMPNNSVKCDGGNIYFRKNDAATVEDFEAFLSAQKAAGTPVFIIYARRDTTTNFGRHPISLSGDTTLTMTAEIDGIELEAEYAGEVGT